MDPATIIARLARDTHGAFRFADTGLSEGQLRTCLARGWIERILPGVGVLVASPASHHRDLAAALLWAGSGAVAAGASSGLLYEAIPTAPNQPVIWTPRDRRHPNVTVIRSAADRRATRRRADGFWASSPEWTLRDLLRTESDEHVELAFEKMRRDRMLTIERMATHLATHVSRNEHNIQALRTLVVDLADTRPCESLLEVRIARALRAARIERPERQVQVGAHRFDFAWPWRCVALECMGAKFHHDPAAWKRDLERLTALGAATGYTILFATWDDAKRPARLIKAVGAAFAARAA